MTGNDRQTNSEVYLLWFVTEDDDNDDGLLIGVYRSEASAKSAIGRLSKKPGFVDHSAGFQIHPRELDQDSWKDGFVQTDV